MAATAEIVIVSNGPGELSGWARPVAQALRTASPSTRLTLVLAPSQFAGGREAAVTAAWGLFDRIVEPAAGMRVALGLDALPVGSPAALVHLGGDLWFSGRLARRLRVPAAALVETTRVAARHRGFSRVFAVSADLADRLTSMGLPNDKLVACGDPRTDAVASALNGRRRPASGAAASTTDGRGSSPVVSFLPGSRDSFFDVLAPYFLQAAHAVAAAMPAVQFQMIVSSFLTPERVQSTREAAGRRWPHLAVRWIAGDPWSELAGSDLTITIPGSNTLELGIAGVPFAVAVPTHQVERIPAEGMAEWVARIPGMGRPLKRAFLRRYLRQRRFAALPNLKAGRQIVPEWIGELAPEELAARIVSLLHDAAARTAIARRLREVYPDPPGAAGVIAQTLLAMAERPLEAAR